MIKIGSRFPATRAWVDDPANLRFLKQIGVDYVDFNYSMFPGYRESGAVVDRDDLARLVEALDGAGLKAQRANNTSDDLQAAWLGRPDAQRAIDNACRTVELTGEFGIPLFGLQPFGAVGFGEFRDAAYSNPPSGRGEYRELAVDIAPHLDMPAFPGAPTRDELWERTVGVYRALCPVAENAGVRIAMHGNDPPVASLHGIPQVLTSFEEFDRLFEEVPSPANGMCFCVGTRYESGQDVFEGIRRFGGRDRIVHVHFRNVRGRIPRDGGYAEVMPDLGELDMYRVAKALDDAGFDGVMDYDHVRGIDTDDPLGRTYIAYCVGHMKGVLQSLESNVGS